MYINDLPVEMLQNIIQKLSACDVFICSQVCQQWKNVVDGLGDQFWKKLCSKEHENVYEEAYTIANLSWRELYISLSLWPNVANADVRVRVIADSADVFQLLKDGMVACAHDFNRDKYPEFHLKRRFSYDTIVYYDLNTLEECHREPFALDSIFKSFKENKIFIVTLIPHQVKVLNYFHVKLKSNNKSFTFGRTGICSGWLTETELYFQCSREKGHLYRVMMVERNNDSILDIEDIQVPKDLRRIKALINVNNKQVNILTLHGRIFSLIGKTVKLLYQTVHCDDELKVLKKYGFKWRSSYTYDYYSYFSNLPLPNGTIAYIYDKIVIIGQILKIDIYYNPYDSEGNLNFSDTTPAKSVALGDTALSTNSSELQTNCRPIYEICVAESLNGHKIIVSCNSRIFSIDLNHK